MQSRFGGAASNLGSSITAVSHLRIGDLVASPWDPWDRQPWVVVHLPDAAAGVYTIGLRRGDDTATCAPWDIPPAATIEFWR